MANWVCGETRSRCGVAILASCIVLLASPTWSGEESTKTDGIRTVYLIRHGATDNNRAKPPRLQGRRTDPGLSDEGLEQAKRTGRFLADVPVHAVYSSPLLRARSAHLR